MKFELVSLGNFYEPESTLFKVFATNVDKIVVRVYDNLKSYRCVDYKMAMSARPDIYELRIDGDLLNKYYNYVVYRGKYSYVVTDPYALSSSANSTRSAIVDRTQLYTHDFELDRFVADPHDIVIYEAHVRDMTMHRSANIKNRGKFLGLCESAYRSDYGIGYIKSMGFTHVHYLPLLDFFSIDELDPKAYNWGYDPESYFVPEGSYATDLNDPKTRILELKRLIIDHHKIGLGVILDVVYNHTFRVKDHSFWALAPEVYYRKHHDGSLSNGSGCGNELNTEHPMVRNLMLQSLIYYVEEFHVDGFRFDLMALMDTETIKLIVDTLKAIKPNIIIYGEPWCADRTPLSFDKQMNKESIHKVLGVSAFNDSYRNALKGDNDGTNWGLIQGDFTKIHDVLTGIAGSIWYNDAHKGYAKEPHQSINYLNSHDNLILYDKLRKSTDYEFARLLDITRIGFAILMFSFGVPFVQAGTEFMRSKQMNHNSYNASDLVNSIDWSLVQKNSDLVDFVADLISTRREIGAFHLYSAKDIKDKVEFFVSDNIISYTIRAKNKNFKNYRVLINPKNERVDTIIDIDAKSSMIFYNQFIEPKDRVKIKKPINSIEIYPYSCMVWEI